MNPLLDATTISHPQKDELWNKAIVALRSMKVLPHDWDGSGAHTPDSLKIESGIQFCTMMKHSDQPAPTSVYPLHDGNVMFEWSFEDGVTVRLEVESPGQGEFMTTYPDHRSAEFAPFQWSLPTSLIARCLER